MDPPIVNVERDSLGTPPPVLKRYLFLGVAVMFGLIAAALLFLVCSYWQISGGDTARTQTECGEQKTDKSTTATSLPPPLEPHVVVVMAGNEKLTFLATPAGASSFPLNYSTAAAPDRTTTVKP